MKFNRKTICLPGKRLVYLLTPEEKSDEMIVTDDKGGNYYIISNGTGYALLSKLFALAISLENHEIAYLPLRFGYSEAFGEYFPGLENHCTGIAVFNYCTTQMGGQDISTALKCEPAKEEAITRDTSFSKEFPDDWKTRHRLTVKKHGDTLIMSGNRDVFTMLAQSVECLSEYGDDQKNNEIRAHRHHDWDENTAKSVGITFYYWHHGGESGFSEKPEQ